MIWGRDAYISDRTFMIGAPVVEKKAVAAKRVLTLLLGRERYALNVMSVREIIRPLEISPVPRAPAEFLGVINLRGKIVPVVDLRIKFGLEFTGRTERTCIVVVQTADRAGGQKATGLLVDEVCEVVALSSADIENAPSFGAGVDATYISGLAKTKDGVTILLDLERLLGEAKAESSQ
jgi:purine-binding chemotaxis protein CheW